MSEDFFFSGIHPNWKLTLLKSTTISSLLPQILLIFTPLIPSISYKEGLAVVLFPYQGIVVAFISVA